MKIQENPKMQECIKMMENAEKIRENAIAQNIFHLKFQEVKAEQERALKLRRELVNDLKNEKMELKEKYKSLESENKRLRADFCKQRGKHVYRTESVFEGFNYRRHSFRGYAPIIKTYYTCLICGDSNETREYGYTNCHGLSEEEKNEVEEAIASATTQTENLELQKIVRKITDIEEELKQIDDRDSEIDELLKEICDCLGHDKESKGKEEICKCCGEHSPLDPSHYTGDAYWD